MCLSLMAYICSALLLLLLFFPFPRAPPTVYGGSQAKGPTGAAAKAYARATATWDLSHVYNLHDS